MAKVTLQEFPPNSLAFLRFALATLFLVPFFWTEITGNKRVKIKTEDLPQLIAVGIFTISLNIAFFFAGITKTTAISASALTLIIPMLSVLLSWIFLKEKIYLINLGGITLGLIGALIIIGLPQVLEGNYSIQTIIGNLLIILASVVFVIGVIFSRKMLNKYSTLTVTTTSFLVGTITFIAPAAREYLQNPGWPNHISMLGGLGLLYMALLSSVSAYFLFEWALGKIGVIKADLLQYIEPFVAAILAVAVLGEKISTSFLIGSVFVAVGVFLGTFAKEVHHRHKAHHH